MVELKIMPSILSADQMCLEKSLEPILKETPYLHVDVMDGHFVPNLAYSPSLTKQLKGKAYLDVHLMIENPENFVKPFGESVQSITFHLETQDPSTIISKIKELGIRCGIAIKPKTKVDSVIPFLHLIDMVLVMTVEPGFGGQKMISECLHKVKVIRELFPDIDIQVDGGVTLDNIAECVKNGANCIVAGSSIFNTDDPSLTIRKFREIAYSIRPEWKNCI